ncbi:MAG: aminodeoxychorismate lyase, partial [Proteobacteria bacterium]|nr:aminodeoxychorismate lyase [Pseudomonadota bacterium]
MNAPPRLLVNGQPATQVSALDRGLQYGDGLFETLRCEQGQLR